MRDITKISVKKIRSQRELFSEGMQYIHRVNKSDLKTESHQANNTEKSTDEADGDSPKIVHEIQEDLTQ